MSELFLQSRTANIQQKVLTLFAKVREDSIKRSPDEILISITEKFTEISHLKFIIFSRIGQTQIKILLFASLGYSEAKILVITKIGNVGLHLRTFCTGSWDA